jgi:AcrR family transcriptional regulator
MSGTALRERHRLNDPHGRRERILDAAEAAFQTRGYHATSTHEVMRDAGVSAGALHHHFPTKKALGLAVIRERVARTIAETWIEPVRESADAADAIGRVCAGIAADLDARGAVRGCPLNNLALELSLTDADFRGAMDEVFAAWRSALAQALGRDSTSGAMRKAEAEDLASFVVAAYSGAMAMAKTSQNTAPLKACARRLADLLPRTGRPRKPTGARRPRASTGGDG